MFVVLHSSGKNFLISFHYTLQTGSSIDEFLEAGKDRKRQPYLLAIGTARHQVTKYFLVIDHLPLPCAAEDAVGAFDALFKAHYVFGLEYSSALRNFWTFIQTTLYEIDVSSTRESPRVREVRAKLQVHQA